MMYSGFLDPVAAVLLNRISFAFAGFERNKPSSSVAESDECLCWSIVSNHRATISLWKTASLRSLHSIGSVDLREAKLLISASSKLSNAKGFG